jgi:ABC-2 type transport system ATP-binding protein
LISLTNVSKQYKGVTVNKDSGVYLWIKNIARLTGNRAASLLAVNDVSFTVDGGEVFGIYGANGAGKTTLIKLLSGLLAPSGGTVEVDGKTDVRHIKNAVSYISTNGWMGLEWQLTARENLILYGNMFGLSGKRLNARCDEVLWAAGMDGAKDKYVSELSAGMRQKITIARGLILNRPVIFYDEPSVSLDVPSARSLRELIKDDAAQNGRTAIIASHSAEDLAICGRVMLLSKGEVIALGTPDELKKPLSGIHMIEIKCLNDGRCLPFEALPGIERVIRDSVEGKRDLRRIKLSARISDFSFDRLIDFLIHNDVAARSVNRIEITLQEVYEYYLARREGGCRAVV